MQRQGERAGAGWGAFLCMVVFAVGVSLVAMYALDRSGGGGSLFTLANLVGPTTQSLLRGDGLTVCTTEMGTPGNPICFHGARMPVASVVVALGIRMFGDHAVAVNAFKTLLMLMPLVYAMWLAYRARPLARSARYACVALLLAPFAITTFLADVVNMQVEEGYSYSLLALAVAMLLFDDGRARRGVAGALVFAGCLAGLYLAKSSMAPVVLVLLVSYVVVVRDRWSRVLVVGMVCAAPVGWAVHQHAASGRFSVGTSLDGINLHKANNEGFLDHYQVGAAALDQYDRVLNRGMQFGDEWSYNDFHERAALGYVREHPGRTLAGVGRKLAVLFVSVRKIGSSVNGGWMEWLELAGLVVFRVMLWVGLAGALRLVWGAGSARLAGWIFLAVVGACVLPYVVGFAYTRHVSVLIYPAGLMCCRLLGVGWLERGARSQGITEGADAVKQEQTTARANTGVFPLRFASVEMTMSVERQG